MKKIQILLLLVALALFAGCKKDPKIVKQTKEITRAFFGDKANNAVIAVDVEDFKMVGSTPTGHELTYVANTVGHTGKAYVCNRGCNIIDVMDCKTLEITSSINLPHFPRSAEKYNEEEGLVALTGMDKPMASIIDVNTDQVIATVGSDEVTEPVTLNEGGPHACGHPFWLDRHHFILSDRGHRKLSTYFIGKSNGKWKTALINTIDLPSPIHQIVPSKGYYKGEPDRFYATAEGICNRGAENVLPSLLELKYNPQTGLTINREVILDSGVGPENMGIHHGDFDPFEKLVYVGSREGTLFVIDYDNMTVLKTIQVGKGVGHVEMIKSKKLAIAVNHKDVFVSIIDLTTKTKIKDVVVSDRSDLVGQTMIQAHPKFFTSEDGKFYSFLAEEGVFYELDLNSLEVSRKLEVGGHPVQGSFVPLTIDVE